MKRRVRPIADSGDKTVLDGIEVDVIDVSFKISIVTNGVLPESALPKGVFPTPVPRDRSARLNDGSRKSTFDQMPSVREICISIRQRHHDMEVIGQNHDRIDRERMLAPRQHHRRAQIGDMIGQDV